MKFGILGDLHLRATRPANRIDDYVNSTQWEKLQQAFETFQEEECMFILQPGDWFDNYGKDPYSVTNSTIALLMLYRIPIYMVFGQHDIKFHNKTLIDIPIQTLNQTDLIHQIPNDKPETIKLGGKKKLKIYGANWGDSIPKARRQKNVTNILLAHTMVIKNKKLWPGQTDYTFARKLPEYGYDLVITGDNHQAFTYKNKVINCGSLMRMRSDQHNHQPMFAIYDTVENELDVRHYDIQPSESVLRMQEVKEEKESVERKNKLAKNLNFDIDETELDYRRNVNRVVKRKGKKLSKRSKDIIEESIS